MKLQSEAKKLVDVIELAKKKALTADLYDTSCTNFSGYQVRLTANNYSLVFCCNDNCTTPSTVQTYNFSTDLTNRNISIFSPAPGTISFPPLMTGFNNTGVSTIEVKNSGIINTNKFLKISISSIGIVDLNETLINC